jgi:hypothetical protein
VGWQSGGELAPLVCVLDPSAYVRRVMRSQALTGVAVRAVRTLMRVRVRRHALSGATLTTTESLGAPLREFAARPPDAAGIVRDTGPEFLAWRYERHPHLQFRFAALRRAGAVRGLLVFEEQAHTGTCVVYDLIAHSDGDLRTLLALFVLRSLGTPGLTSVRVLLDAHHPARVPLHQCGFITRPVDAVFQVRPGGVSGAGLVWRISNGDKDT